MIESLTPLEVCKNCYLRKTYCKLAVLHTSCSTLNDADTYLPYRHFSSGGGHVSDI